MPPGTVRAHCPLVTPLIYSISSRVLSNRHCLKPKFQTLSIFQITHTHAHIHTQTQTHMHTDAYVYHINFLLYMIESIASKYWNKPHKCFNAQNCGLKNTGKAFMHGQQHSMPDLKVLDLASASCTKPITVVEKNLCAQDNISSRHLL